MNPPSSDDAGPDVPSGPLPENGKIIVSQIAQTIMAVAFLIAVTLLSFLGVAFIGKLIG